MTCVVALGATRLSEVCNRSFHRIAPLRWPRREAAPRRPGGSRQCGHAMCGGVPGYPSARRSVRFRTGASPSVPCTTPPADAAPSDLHAVSERSGTQPGARSSACPTLLPPPAPPPRRLPPSFWTECSTCSPLTTSTAPSPCSPTTPSSGRRFVPAPLPSRTVGRAAVAAMMSVVFGAYGRVEFRDRRSPLAARRPRATHLALSRPAVTSAVALSASFSDDGRSPPTSGGVEDPTMVR